MDKSSAPDKKKGSMPWGILVCVGLWMFGLGVLVGRGTAPVTFEVTRLEQKLAQLRLQVAENDRKKAEAGAAGPASAGQTPVKFYEELDNNSREHSLNAGTSMASSAPGRAARPVTIKRKIVPPSVSGKASERAPKVKPPEKSPVKKSEMAASKAKPAPPEKTSAGAYAVQVAALKDRAVADEVAGRLIKSGFPAYVVAAKSGGIIWHRVRVGPLKTKDMGKKMVGRLKKAGFDGFLLKRPKS